MVRVQNFNLSDLAERLFPLPMAHVALIVVQAEVIEKKHLLRAICGNEPPQQIAVHGRAQLLRLELKLTRGCLNSEAVLAPDGKLDIGEFALAIEHFALARPGDAARLRAVVEAGDFLARRA